MFAAFWDSVSTEPRVLPVGGEATDVNDLGHLSLSSYTAMFWSEKTGVIDCGVLAGATISQARRMNDLDQISGLCYLFTGSTPIFWSFETGMLNMGDLPGGGDNGVANDINNAGIAVGWSESDIGGRGFLWDIANGIRPIPAGADGNWIVDANAINELDQVAGSDAFTGAAMWDPVEGIIPAGTLPYPHNGNAYAMGINDRGQMVGPSFKRVWPPPPPNTPLIQAFLWDREHGMRRISDLIAAGTPPIDADIGFAWDINNRGQIACRNNIDSGLVLTPFFLGDMNCDDLVNAFDIDPFVLYLSEPAAYAAEYPNCAGRWPADANQDGVVNNFDIDAFVELLEGQ
ncbi:MAG: hypothetical protein JNG88_14280 [Phycisphaerales bacterium]|nr:hypothetical protein [Phycisphaerales bacterium]